jgi:hypothetical protein
MITFRRLWEYIDAAHKMKTKSASYGHVVEALADVGFVGATAEELRTLVRAYAGFHGHAPRAESAAQ